LIYTMHTEPVYKVQKYRNQSHVAEGLEMWILSLPH
jgi:hypothetical protein